MLQYTNSFSTTLSDAKDSLVIHFYQNEPIIKANENGETYAEIQTHSISSIIMDINCAKNLASTLGQINAVLEQSDSEK